MNTRLYNNLLTTKSQLKEQRHAGAIHWPIFASLKIRHFDHWFMNFKPVGISEDLHVDFDGRTESSFQLAMHDVVAHDLPSEFIPYMSDFQRFQDYLFMQFESKAALEKELLYFIWFFLTHERSQLFIYFASCKEAVRPDMAIKEIIEFRNFDDYWSAKELVGRLRSPKDLGSEASDYLQKIAQDGLAYEKTQRPIVSRESQLQQLDHDELHRRVVQAYKVFREIILAPLNEEWTKKYRLNLGDLR